MEKRHSHAMKRDLDVKFLCKMKNRKNKKGLSQIIATMIMIVLVLGAASIVFGVVNNLISEEIENSESCFGNFGKVTINNQYTCYDSDSNEIRFLVNVGDIKIDGFLVSVAGKSGAKSFEIKNNAINFVRIYNGVYGGAINPPKENSGLTYFVNLSEMDIEDADSVTIAPIIDGTQCEVSDSLAGIDNCKLLN